MRTLLALAVVAVACLLPSAGAATSSGRPVALVTAETENEVLAVSLGPDGGHILRRVHLADPLMIAAPVRGPAVVVSPSGTVTLLAWHTLRPIAAFHSFRAPKVAAIAPSGRLAYVTDERTGDLSVIDLAHRVIVGHVFVGAGAHHLAISPDGRRIWVALGETATTIVRLDSSNPRRPRVVGSFRPRYAAHDLRFEPDGQLVWVTSAASPLVATYAATDGRLIDSAAGGRAPQHVAFSGRRVLITSGYGSTLIALCWRSPPCRKRVVPIPYGSFNLSTLGNQAVATSLLTGDVTELGAGSLKRLWTTKVAPAARYVAISVWPR